MMDMTLKMNKRDRQMRTGVKMNRRTVTGIRNEANVVPTTSRFRAPSKKERDSEEHGGAAMSTPVMLGRIDDDMRTFSIS